jgi:hypothetical protein
MISNGRKVYLVDSNTFITPFKNYYPFDFAPSFWEFFGNNILNGNIAVLSKVYDEVSKGTDELSVWIKGLNFTKIDHRASDILSKYQVVLTHIQISTSLYNDKALAEWADNSRADAWLVAAAIANGYKIVTFERPNGSLGVNVTSHPKIPDVAANFGIECISLYEMIRDLGFSF